MKKLLAAFCMLLLIFATAACGQREIQESTAATDTQAPTQTQMQTEAPTQAPTEEPFELVLEDVSYSQDAAQIRTSSVTGEVLEKLPQMTALELVTVTEGGSGENLEQLRTYCDENGIAFQIEVAGQTVTDETAELSISDVTEGQADLLAFMPNLRNIHFPEPQAPAEALLELRTKLPETVITWEKTVLGMTFPCDAVEIDLSPVLSLGEGQSLGDKTAYEYGLEFETMGTQEKPHRTAKVLPEHPFPDRTDNTEQIILEAETAMAYFPNAETLFMCGTWLENESMSQFRERHRGDYKVVWSVLCGDLAPRTDAKFFMPTKYYVTSGNFNDLYSYNLMYCEEIVAMDIGHMHISDIDFVRYMPNLTYLVMLSQPVTDLSPLAECKKLVFLELAMCDWITDYTPLQECTALEDLSVERASENIEPLFEMTWLKNLWLGDVGQEKYRAAVEALPNTNVVYNGTTGGAWRDLPNYFKMRDALLMFYMD